MPAPADRITSIVEQAVLLERNDRTRFLDETCQDDELRRMVDAVLADIDRPLILDRPVDEAVAHLFCDNQPAMVGTRIGPYRIESPLGAGGMGQVYRATDSRLGRQVAIKTLPPMLAGDPDRVARFERESKVLAALNHPHIAAIYGIETDAVGAALVLELVEGQTLEEILTRGALPLDEALALSRQLADALDAAHQMGIVHRDLKPSNIKVREDGTLKVLDFGLAKLAQPDVAPAAAAAPTRSPTIATPAMTPAMTTAGMILGTAAYMAPEQARGKPVDKRADIFAFGAVLYEMLTGRRAFPGDDVAETLAAVEKSAPDWTAVPAALHPLLQRCLEKDPRRRLRDIGDAIPALEPGHAAVDRHDRPSRGPWMVAAAATIVAVLAVGVARVNRRNAAVPAARYAELAPGDGWQIDTSRGTTAARDGSPLVISPNGRYVAQMVRNADGASGVVIRDLQTGREQHIAGTGDASSLFWKPDSSTLAFVAGGALRKVSADGSAVSAIAPVPSGVMGGVLGATWGPDDTIVFAAGYSGRRGLTRVSAAGGTANDAVPPVTDRSEVTSMPWFLPDGRHILYTASPVSSDGPKRLYVQALGSSERQVLGTVGARNVQYAAGHLLYVDGDRRLMARPFDPERRMFTGEPTPVAEQVRTRVALGGSDAFFSSSEAGTLVYQAGPGLAVQLTVKDRSGKALRTLGEPGAIRNFTLAHDGRRAAVMVGNAIWIYDLDQDRSQRLQLPEAFVAIWSPDDTQIAFARLSPGATAADIFRKDLNSATPEEPLLVAADFQLPLDWHSDRLFFVQGPGPFSNNDIWVLPLTGSRRPYPLVQTPHNDTRPRVAPNGRFFAYVTDDTGRPQVYVAPLPDPPDGVGTTSSTFLPGRMSVSTNGGTSPRWRGDGRELYFVDSAAGMIMAASVDTSQGRITVGRPQPLFPIATDALLAWDYDVFGDGQRFLVRVPHAPDTTHATVVFNWTALLQK